ncbi:MAG: UDP-N-acetylglucosamine 2-epimerase (non-hydrolyzing) [Bacteroidetes bacterium]|nr:UDP-N-acetylglucosamine 2-epimerase (non-hydrolyzing) [Bacteroidota bacterium]
MKILSVVGARPNFIKLAPFVHAVNKHNAAVGQTSADYIDHVIVHTGQHYDDKMSAQFFKELDIPQPAINLGIGSGSHAEQVGNTMIEFEKVIREQKPHWVVVLGDVNATLACSITAKKEWVKCCHIEAGLRSGDMKMPEEINRIVTDSICDLLLTPDTIAGENLRREGAAEKKIKFVGNIMIDTLEMFRHKAEKLAINEILIKNNIFNPPIDGRFIPPEPPQRYGYGIVTLHRPSNVDDISCLTEIVNFLCNEVVNDINLIWPIHPRTLKNLREFNLWKKVKRTRGMILLDPISYIEMLRLNMDAKIIFTDSGGLQEECTVLGTPCLTMRWNTERPVTLTKHGGVSVLVGNDIEKIREEYLHAVASPRRPVKPALWDGKTADRCLKAILNY